MRPPIHGGAHERSLVGTRLESLLRTRCQSMFDFPYLLRKGHIPSPFVTSLKSTYDLSTGNIVAAAPFSDRFAGTGRNSHPSSSPPAFPFGATSRVRACMHVDLFGKVRRVEFFLQQVRERNGMRVTNAASIQPVRRLFLRSPRGTCIRALGAVSSPGSRVRLVLSVSTPGKARVDFVISD